MPMIGDPQQIMKNAVYAALTPLNANTSPTYPKNFYDAENPPTWPLTVYDVQIRGDIVLRRRDRRVRVTVSVDHFGPTRGGMSDLAGAAREAVMEIIPWCDMDAESEIMPGRIHRRSQRFSGTWDLQSGMITK